MALVDPNRLVDSASPYFRWVEFSGWEHADAVELARGRALVRDLLSPARRALGPIRVTSWLYWSNGTKREPAHGDGAAFDAVPGPGASFSIRQLYEWLRDNTWYGELILEPDHVHGTLPGFGGSMQALVEVAPKEYATDPNAPPFAPIVVEAGMHTAGGLLLMAGIGVGLWRARPKGDE